MAALAAARAVRRSWRAIRNEGPGDEGLVNIRGVLKALRQDGWILKNQEGSYRQFVHPLKAGKVTVAGHESDDVPPKTLKSILKQAGLK
jgi:predicted RNA binding protein YcfA (HicA-like mRNA interferase family)